MREPAELIDGAGETKDYKAFRLSVAPMMDWSAVPEK